MTSRRPDPTLLTNASRNLLHRKRASDHSDGDEQASKRLHSDRTPDFPGDGDGDGRHPTDIKSKEEVQTHESTSTEQPESSHCVLQQQGRGDTCVPAHLGPDLEWATDHASLTLKLCLPLTYESVDPGRQRRSRKQLDPEHTDDLLATLLESLHPDACPANLFDTVWDHTLSGSPEIKRYLRRTAEQWYAKHADAGNGCTAEHLASRRKRLLEGFELAGELPKYVIQPETGSTGIFYNKFLALNSTRGAALTRNRHTAATKSDLLPTAISRDHPCHVSLVPGSLCTETYHPVTGVASLEGRVVLELCSGARRGLPQKDDRVAEYEDALRQCLNRDGDVKMIRALRRIQRERSFRAYHQDDHEASDYLDSLATDAVRTVFESQRHTFDRCVSMLDWPENSCAIPVHSKFLRSQPMTQAEVMDEALIRLEELVGQDRHGAQTPTVIDCTLSALVTLPRTPPEGLTLARWSTTLRETVESIHRGFGDHYRLSRSSMEAKILPKGEVDPRCKASARIVSAGSVPETKRQCGSSNDLAIEQYIEVEAYLRPKDSSDDQFYAKEGFKHCQPIRRVQPHWYLGRTDGPEVGTHYQVSESAEDTMSRDDGQRGRPIGATSSFTLGALRRRYEELRAVVQE